MSDDNPFLALAPNLTSSSPVGGEQAPGGGGSDDAGASSIKIHNQESPNQIVSNDSNCLTSSLNERDNSNSPVCNIDGKQSGIHNLLVWITRTVVDQNFKPQPSSIPKDKLSTSIKKCALLPDPEGIFKSNYRLLTIENLAEVVFERMMMVNLDTNSSKNECMFRMEMYGYKDEMSRYDGLQFNPAETRILHYIYACFARLQAVKSSKFLNENEVGQLESIFIRQASLHLCNPDLDPRFDEIKFKGPENPIYSLLMEYHNKDDTLNHYEILKRFLSLLADDIHAKELTGDEGEVHLTSIIRPTIENLAAQFSKISLTELVATTYFKALDILISNQHLAKSLVEANIPATPTERNYLNTLFCRILSISCLPNLSRKGYEFFLNPSKSSPSEIEITENQIGTQLSELAEVMHSFFLRILKTPARSELLRWIGESLHAFKDRGKLWTNETLEAPSASDGMMMNLTGVLLRLSKPFSQPFSPKLLKIDPRYLRASVQGKNIHLRGMQEESFLIPPMEDAPSQSLPDEFNFMTECFFATHQALNLGFRSLYDRFLRLTQDLNQIRRAYEEAHQSLGENGPGIDMIRTRMETSMTHFLCMKAVLSEQQFIQMLLDFLGASASWLCNIGICETADEASRGFKSLKAPLPEVHSFNLEYIPEFMIDNVIDVVTFIKRFMEKTFSNPNVPFDPIMSLVLVFMGSKDRAKNPHLRAKLAEALECLMPGDNHIGFDMREHFFSTHSLSSEIVPTLLNVFVSIEMTGEGVQFEQKFQYRRPMYLVLEYLWSKNLHKNRMKELARESEKNIDAARPPIFLRFINLLMNDATFLLDEALQYMSKIREAEQQKESGAWNNLPHDQRIQQEMNFQHLGRLAKFHNVIGMNTIHTLNWLTEEIHTIFCHPSLVDRIACMLNYFLHILVGPNKRSFKVNQMSEYEFKPGDIVFEISSIYLHLASEERNPSWKEFCLAVTNDGRSFSRELLMQASNVLFKVGRNAVGSEMAILNEKILEMDDEQRRMDFEMDDIPEEFLDPIMSTLMVNPVKLPSGKSIDKSTIARHLLSDQTDPFTRSPLTMEDCVPDEELKAKIEEFVASQRAKAGKQ